ncbi:hypothetical protein ACQ4WX_07905 [Streptomyces lasalocidi]
MFDGDADGTAAKTGASALSTGSRAYISTLMSQVVPEQSWGVSAAGSRQALKNGWLQRVTSGLWDVNSIGQVTVNGHRYLVVVLSNGSASMAEGVSLVERTARAAIA